METKKTDNSPRGTGSRQSECGYCRKERTYASARRMVS